MKLLPILGISYSVRPKRLGHILQHGSQQLDILHGGKFSYDILIGTHIARHGQNIGLDAGWWCPNGQNLNEQLIHLQYTSLVITYWHCA